LKKFNEIAEFAKELMAESELQNILNLIAKEAKKLLSADRCSVFLVDKDDAILSSMHSDGIGRIVVSLDAGIVGETYKSAQPQVVNAPYEDKRFLQNIDTKSGYKTQNIITVPIFNSKREVMGIMQLLNKSRGDFNAEDLETLTFFANYISGTLELSLMHQ